MRRFDTELAVGVFVVVGLACVAFLAWKLGGLEGSAGAEYRLSARFVSVSGLKEGARVELAGVPVGRVAAIDLDADAYEAVVELALREGVRVQEDATASIRTEGIIGEKFVKLSPGGAERVLSPGDELVETEPSISLEELISKYIFESRP